MTTLRGRLLCALALALAAVPAAPAVAAMPKPDTFFVHHDHSVAGRGWHVELDIDRNGKAIRGAVVYVEECGETIFGENLPIRPDGTFSGAGTMRRGKVTWTIDGRFVSTTEAHGTFRVTAPKCGDTGVRAYDAHTPGAGEKHDHSTALVIGNQAEYPPAMDNAAPNVRRARKLRMASLRNVWRYDTLAEAYARGYVFDEPAPDQVPCPGTHHMRKHKASFWGKFLNPRKPQSLVWWCNSAREFQLAAFMFRAPKGRPPTTMGDLLQWHRHGPRGTWMTHLWLVPDTPAALATCAPFKAFARYGGRIAYERYNPDILLDAPCSDTPGLTD
jgi:hypothetical protein